MTSPSTLARKRRWMPVWLGTTAASGSFRANVLQKDPALLTLQHCLVWVERPSYESHYPFGEHHVFNQVSTSYLHPLSAVERCVAGTHVPSMLILCFELLRKLEGMAAMLTLAPVVDSGMTTAAVIASAVASVYIRRYLLTLRFLKEQARQMAELKTTGMLYFFSDQNGYRWTLEDEERAEYEYREELRQRARRK
ncbi:putative chaperone protein DNAj [Trypanosoma rangeli]|uniref:Putative chaperone protein DNAj n=1 Tax=Trypanosoma rangeli TaxID=5698 RepID=A0A422NX47_TRYRA|nr:putative chaperone protein DNAj [Trypanosoma rangeli]RNF10103.1 putative chaperone protein DNAj [Trypanosoma rangeli]|eukprot:RNF10103.1 putative chaperone protein DNAj [Trypanosoma rangeli]